MAGKKLSGYRVCRGSCHGLINPGDEYWAIGGERKLYFHSRYCLHEYFVKQFKRRATKEAQRHLSEKDYERMADKHIKWLLKMKWCVHYKH